MTGARIVTDLDDKAVLGALTRLRQVTKVNVGMMRAIGKGIQTTTQKRMSQGVDADGNPFAPLNPAYAAIKVGPGILIGRGGMQSGLQGTITYEASLNQVIVGGTKKYAAIHQFGGKIVPKNAKALVFKLGAGGGVVRVKSVTIPARPYLGFGAQEIEVTLDVVETFTMRALKT